MIDDIRAPTSACSVEAIAQAYLTATEGDEGQALRIAIADALADLLNAGWRARANSRLISRSFVPSGLGNAGTEA